MAPEAEQAASVAEEVAVPPEIEALSDYLGSGRAPAGSMILPELDGFLTAIAVGPEMIAPGEWLPEIWGGEEPCFTDRAEAQAVLDGIMSLHNGVLLQVGDGTFEPLIGVTAEGDPLAEEWVEGFVTGMSLRLEAWQPLIKSKKSDVLLFPILALCRDQNGESPIGLDAETLAAIYDDVVDGLPASVIAIADYWSRRRPRRKAGTGGEIVHAAGHVAIKAGRNEPCPCGSGKKYKKCCGGAAPAQ